jgi:hypothetical protein
MWGNLLYVCKAWIVLGAFYLLFAGQLSWTEAGAGAFATSVAAAATTLRRNAEAHEVSLRLGLPGLRATVLPLIALFPDAARIGVRLLSALRRRPDGEMGMIVEQPFIHGDEHDGGRRAVVVLGASLAPNGFVLRVPSRRNVLVMHRLAPVPPNPDAVWPV